MSEEQRRYVIKGDALRDTGHFLEAAEAYRRAIELDSTTGWIYIQLGNMLKDLGRFAEAEDAYRAGLASGADTADANLQLGRALRLDGRRDAAVAALLVALKASPNSSAIIEELIAVGENWLVQNTSGLGAFNVIDIVALFSEMTNTIRNIERRLPGVEQLAVIPLKNWNLWRSLWRKPDISCQSKRIGFAALPHKTSLASYLKHIETIERQKNKFRATYFSISDTAINTEIQRRFSNSSICVVRGGDNFSKSLSYVLEDIVDFMSNASVDWVVIAQKPVLLDPDACAWFASISKLEFVGAFCDEDAVLFGESSFGSEPFYSDPNLKGAADPELLNQGYSVGSVVAFSVDKLKEILQQLKSTKINLENEDIWIELQRGALKSGRLHHIPHVLSTELKINSQASKKLNNSAITKLERMAEDNVEEIDVIVPTRDRVDLLIKCLSSLRDTCDVRTRYRVTVVDNGSAEPEMQAFLNQAKNEGRVFRVLRDDKPFNWSILNNKAVALCDGPIVVFINNDVEMISMGWDTQIRCHLKRADVGAIGARLLYPDGTIQHAGIVLEMERSGSEHEGRNFPKTESGPQGRWLKRRSVAAVTGAFLACRRHDFDMVGGFDEQQCGIWFGDIDFCLKLRDRELRILYDPKIEAIHHESKTLSVEFNDEQRDAHFQSALNSMRLRWGSLFEKDPYYNPHYSRWGSPFVWLRSPVHDRI